MARSGPGPVTRCGKNSRSAVWPLLQFDAFRIDAGAAPVAVGGAQQFGGVKPAGLGVVGIHMRDRVRLGLDQRCGIRDVGEDIARAQVDDAAETGDQMRALDGHLVEAEVGEVREHLGFRMAP